MFCAKKSRPSKWKLHISNWAALVLVEEKRVHTICSQTTAFCSHENSRTFREDSNFKLQIDNLYATVHSKLCQHSQYSTTLERKHVDENGDYVVRPEEFGGGRGGNCCSWKDSNRTLDFSTAITRLELHSVERNHLPVLTEGRKEERRTKKGLI